MKVGWQVSSLRKITGQSYEARGTGKAFLVAGLLLWPTLAGLALDRVEARRGGVSMSGFMTGATDFQFGVNVRGTRDQKIEQLQRELRLLEFERDVFQDLSLEISYSGTNRLISQCLAELSAKIGKSIPMDFGTNDFETKEFIFDAITLRDVIKYLVAFNGAILDVSGGKLVCRPVRQALSLDQSEYDLLQLMRKQKFGAVKEILSTNTIDVKQIRDQDGQTLLHLAAWRNQTSIAERLVALGADLNVKDHVGYTPLHEAVRSGSRGCTELLLKNNADLATVDNSGNSPLETAIYYGFLDLARMLVRQGANVDLCTASALGLVDQVRTFLDQEAAQHPRRNDSANSQPKQEPEFSIQFTSSRTRFSPFGTATPLHCAARGGSVEVASLLVSRGASISALDGQGRTPLFWAVEAGRLETARFLVEHGADVNGTNLGGSTPLLTASRDTVSPELIGFLIKAGADVKTTDGQGENGLHKLAWYGYPEQNVETAQILLDAGADITSRNKDGKTPLDILLDNSFQNPSLVKLYRKYAAKAQSGSGK